MTLSRSEAAAADLHARGFLAFRRLPGVAPVLTVDAGGERWLLDGLPLHAGDGVEVLAVAERAPCPACDCEHGCPVCGGSGELLRPTWWPARWEYRNAGDGLLYLPLCCGREERHAVRVNAGDGLRLRWPGRGDREHRR